MTTPGDNFGDRDDRLDELLRSAMNDEAETVAPTGDGLSRIQRRVAARRSRLRWLRPTVALGSAAAVALIGVGAYALVSNNSDTLHVNTPPTTQLPTTVPPSESATPTPVPVAAEAFPKLAIFPFTNAADEKTWETAYAAGHSRWESDPTAVATNWVNNILGQPTVDQIIQKTPTPTTDSITLGRVIQGESSQPIAVTTVRLVKFANAWIVVGADDPAGDLSLSGPTPGDTVSSPVTVSGPGFGVDETVQVDVRDPASPTSFGSTQGTGFGSGVPQWTTDVGFTQPAGPVGVVVAVVGSNRDSGPARIVAEQVRFGAASASSVPRYFYAVKDGRITQFASRNGAALHYLTDPQTGGSPSDPQLLGSDIYYLRSATGCANTLMKVSTSGGTPQSVTTPDNGYAIAGFGMTTDATMVAFYETQCSGGAAKLVMQKLDTTGAKHVIDFSSQPPALEADPSFVLGTGWAAFVRSGTLGHFVTYDDNATSTDGSGNPCSGYDVNTGLPQALEVDGTGVLWFATQTGSSMQVVKCAAGKPTVAFTVPGQDAPADVDVTSDGSAVLLTDTAGKVWRWDGSGQPTELAPSVPLDHVTW